MIYSVNMVGKICTVCRKCSFIDKELSFFTYPGDRLRRYEWLVAVNRLDLMDKLDNDKTRGNHRICEVHFERKYVLRCKLNEGRKYLAKDAFPTLRLAKPNMVAPQSNKNLLNQQSSIMCKQNNFWKDNYTEKETTIDVRQTSTSKYNLRPNKNKRIIGIHEEKAVENYDQEVANIEMLTPQAPFHYDYASQFCESVLKATKCTQTPPIKPAENKTTLNDSIIVKREKTDKALSENDTFLQMCSKFLSPSLYKLVKWNLDNANGKQSINFTLFALTLYYSSNLYNLLREMLSLPTRETLKYFLLPTTTKISENLLNAFKCKISTMSTTARICSFCVGSITLKPNLYYDIKYDRIIGFQDIDGIQNIYLAKYAVLVMVQGILENWKQPIAYAFISEFDNVSKISMWIDDVLGTLIDIGLDIRAFVSDPRSEYLYTSASRFVTPEKTYFMINGANIYYTYDTSQLLKIVKNNLKSCDFYYDTSSKTNNNVEFLKKLHYLCNMLSSKLRYSDSKYKRAFSNKKYQRLFLNHVSQVFENLKVVRKTDGADVTGNMKFIESFQITINSVLQLYEDLNFLGVKYLLTSRLSHDSLHRLFSYMKQSDCKDECTPRQFHKCFVRSLVFSMLKKPRTSNSLEHSIDFEDFSQKLFENEVQETSNNSNEPILIHTTDYRENLPEQNAFVYVCGYCYLKCIQVHKCDAFLIYIEGLQNKQERNNITFLCSVSLDLNVQKCKMLPPDDFTDFLMLLESKFKEYFTEDIQIGSIGHEILKDFEQYGFGMPCPCFPLDYLKALFVRIRLFYTIRKNNKLFKKRKGTKLFRVFSL